MCVGHAGVLSSINRSILKGLDSQKTLWPYVMLRVYHGHAVLINGCLQNQRKICGDCQVRKSLACLLPCWGVRTVFRLGMGLRLDEAAVTVGSYSALVHVYRDDTTLKHQ